ncbi:MAG: CDP-diacylglycerol--glycerol-3-phosphate 3-phosphatidyltransferase [Treponema sp.]|jgi:CDP-diacylglycerol--glycerol-3-phosphate 3-phosphatidyltransferase|nr:CDP-diacylglycerol--glycerol-3-phosphate 3-phosphatidyltransferase [Treponema sp.]
MTLADKITSLRLIMAPVFFVVFLLPLMAPDLFPGGSAWTIPVLWGLYGASEITDLIDGQVARRLNQGSDFGKLFDPFADTLTQITYFLCFVLADILPAFLFLAVLYREFSILFIRNLMLRKGITMGARMGGKIKTVTYILAGGIALLAVSAERLGLEGPAPALRTAALGVFIISVVFSVLSFLDYVKVYREAQKG